MTHDLSIDLDFNDLIGELGELQPDEIGDVVERVTLAIGTALIAPRVPAPLRWLLAGPIATAAREAGRLAERVAQAHTPAARAARRAARRERRAARKAAR